MSDFGIARHFDYDAAPPVGSEGQVVGASTREGEGSSDLAVATPTTAPVGSEGPPVRAADVLATARMDWKRSYEPADDYGPDLDTAHVLALLAHGSEHGVAILAGDGSLRPLTEGEQG